MEAEVDGEMIVNDFNIICRSPHWHDNVGIFITNYSLSLFFPQMERQDSYS